jgi:predicted glycosyltransferase involved in capsule biosynthesis
MDKAFSMERIAIVMGYHNRKFQILQTLATIESQNIPCDVIIVDDNSKEPLELPTYSNINVHLIHITDKNWINPVIAFNRGFHYAMESTTCETILIQGSECFHVGNILEYAGKNSNTNNYITFGCYSIDKEVTHNLSNLQSTIQSHQHPMLCDRGIGWYNHSIHRPCALEWCAAIHRSNMITLNGYDERFAHGYACGDVNFLHRIKKLGLEIQIIDNPFVVHQWHETLCDIDSNSIDLHAKNLNICNEITDESISAKHLYTPDFK